MKRTLIFFLIICNLCSCKNDSKQVLFELHEANETGLNFQNKLTATPEFNMFKYMYFYNGAGAGAADFNNDGMTDLFFASNQGQNKLFLNEGKLHFKDVTSIAQIPNDGGWSTGVSVVDINNDGMLDIYICRVGQFETLKGKNQLLICTHIDKNGIPHFEDKASDYGLNFSGFSTQAAFFDYDLDGDLDMFLLNHSVHQNGTFAERKNFIGTYHPLSGDRIYKNENNHFSDVTKETGINSSAIGYGLGICISDINLDGFPDIYIGNDFHENDYLYINQKNGSFKEVLNEQMMHTSQFSMGVDIADLNNDAYPEIVSVDMLPEDPYILKRSLGEDEYNTFKMKLGYGYNNQFTRNNLQLNRRNDLFSEVGLYSGIAATDWSWAPLFMDFNNDGNKDLFISNGIPKRLNDIDYVNYVSNEEVQRKIDANKMDEKEMAVVEKFPQIKLPNKFYLNKGNMAFEDLKGQIGNDLPTFSNGSIYADLDNDGDLDIVVNNIDDPVMLYENRNNTIKTSNNNQWAELKISGNKNNINAVGSRLLLFKKDSIYTYEKYPVHGFLSSMEIPFHIGLGKNNIDSAVLIWPDNTFEHIDIKANKQQNINYKIGLPIFDFNKLKSLHQNPLPLATNITATCGLSYLHQENSFNEFDRELLIPHMTSREGPALCVGDINGDQLEDVFMGSSKGTKAAIFIQDKNGYFTRSHQPEIDNDSTYEETDAIWADVNNDHCLDLVIADGGNEYYGNSEYLKPRIFLNDGKGKLSKKENAFGDIYVNASCVVANDFNNDGKIDLFIGGRTVPYAYGQTPKSYLLINNGEGNFTDKTSNIANEISHIGFVTGASVADLDNDGDNDFLVSLEWGAITAFINTNGQFKKKNISDKNGWWNFVKTIDIDHDGDLDIIAGNLGLNSRLKASTDEPVRLYYNDFDNNDTKEQILTYYLQHKEIPFANKDELTKQLPPLKKKYLYAENLAKASINEIFGENMLSSAETHFANYFSSALFINDGKLNFTIKALPPEAQFSPMRDAVFLDVDKDNNTDILMIGNYYENNIEMGRYDADFGTVLINKGKGNFKPSTLNGICIKGESRHIRPIQIKNSTAYIISKNNDTSQVFSIP